MGEARVVIKVQKVVLERVEVSKSVVNGSKEIAHSVTTAALSTTNDLCAEGHFPVSVKNVLLINYVQVYTSRSPFLAVRVGSMSCSTFCCVSDLLAEDKCVGYC